MLLTFQTALLQLMMWEEVAIAAKVMIGSKASALKECSFFNHTCSVGRRVTVHIDLYDSGGQKGAGVDWQRCGGESSE